MFSVFHIHIHVLYSQTYTTKFCMILWTRLIWYLWYPVGVWGSILMCRIRWLWSFKLLISQFTFFQWKSTFEIWFLLYFSFFHKHGYLSWGNSVVSKFTDILFMPSALNTPLDNSDSSFFDMGKKGFLIVKDDIQTVWT